MQTHWPTFLAVFHVELALGTETAMMYKGFLLVLIMYTGSPLMQAIGLGVAIGSPGRCPSMVNLHCMIQENVSLSIRTI